MLVGTFTPARNGGWLGAIRTLTIDTKVRLDNPSLPVPFTVALFPSDERDKAQLVWNRRREDRA